MEGELWAALYPLVIEEDKRRRRRPRVQYRDAIILLVALWAILHDRPICWACRSDNWGPALPWLALPAPGTMSTRLRTLSVQLLLEQVFARLLCVTALSGFCLCRRIDHIAEFCQITEGDSDAVARFVPADRRWLVLSVNALRLQAVPTRFHFRARSSRCFQRTHDCVSLRGIVLLRRNRLLVLRNYRNRDDCGVWLSLDDRVTRNHHACDAPVVVAPRCRHILIDWLHRLCLEWCAFHESGHHVFGFTNGFDIR